MIPQSYRQKQHGIGTKTDIWISATEESPKINPHTYGQLIFNKGGKNIKWRKVSSTIDGGKMDSYMKIKEIRILPSHHI